MSFSTFSSLRAMATDNGTKDAKVALITGITGQGLLYFHKTSMCRITTAQPFYINDELNLPLFGDRLRLVEV